MIMFFFLPVLAIAQDSHQCTVSTFSNTNFHHFVDQYSKSDGHDFSIETLERFLHKLHTQQKRFATDKAFLKYLFKKTHQQFLTSYVADASFTQLKKGTYNCLTGTALYALLLDHFKMEHKIIETNYHIFLLIHTSEGKVLLEATDPIGGFVDDDDAIENRIALYKQNSIQQHNGYDKTYYRFNFELYNEVNLYEMLGLLHYNLAVMAFNNQEFSQAISHLDKAIVLYRSPRIEEFSKIVLLSVVTSNMEVALKENYSRKLQMIQKKTVDLVASAH